METKPLLLKLLSENPGNWNDRNYISLMTGFYLFSETPTNFLIFPQYQIYPHLTKFLAIVFTDKLKSELNNCFNIFNSNSVGELGNIFGKCC